MAVLSISLLDLAGQLPATDIFNTAVAKTTGYSLIVGGIIAVGLAAMKIGHIFFEDGVKYLVDKQAAEEKYREIIRVISMLILLTAYPLWMGALTGSLTFFHKMTTVDITDLGKLEKVVDDMFTGAYFTEPLSDEFLQEAANGEDADPRTKEMAERKAQNNDKNINSSITDENPDSANSPNFDPSWIWNVVSEIISAIVIAISMFARYLMIWFIKGSWMLVIIVGPLAIAWSIWYKDILAHYMKVYLNAGFAILTLNLIDILAINFLHEKTLNLNTSIFNDPANASDFMFSFVIAAAYFSSFKITSWYIGKNAGAVAGKAVTVVAAAVGGALMTIAASKGAGGSAMKSILETVAKETKNTGKD